MKRSISLFAISVIGLLMAGLPAYGTVSVQCGNWNDITTWESGIAPFPNIIPSSAHTGNDQFVSIAHGQGVTADTAGSAVWLFVGRRWSDGFQIGSGVSHDILTVQAGADLTFTGQGNNFICFSVGYHGNHGILRMTGGSITCTNWATIGHGAAPIPGPQTLGQVYMSGGTFQTTGNWGNLYFGNYHGNGEFYQSGGTVDISGDLKMNEFGGNDGDASVKYVISGNSTLIARNQFAGWNRIGTNGAGAEFRVIGSDPNIMLDRVLHVNSAIADHSPVMGFEIDENGIAPIKMVGVDGGKAVFPSETVYDAAFFDGTVFDITGGRNGESHVLVDGIHAIHLGTHTVSDPSRYSLRVDATNNDLIVDIISTGCNSVIPGDFNGDCIVDEQDVIAMALQWLENNLP
jgi:hypothetical protein